MRVGTLCRSGLESSWLLCLYFSSPLPWRRPWQPTPVLLPGKSHGRRSLVGCSPWSLEESDTTERLHFHFSLLCIGEGNGNPLQCSCLENPRDGGSWWAAVYGVAQSRTRLKRLSSSSSSIDYKQQEFILPQFWSPKLRCQDLNRAEAPGENSSLPLPSQPVWTFLRL